VTTPRYRFGPFLLSPRRRLLIHDGVEQRLIPRYFDLLVFLVERRGDAVHRREIFERVWTDVIVSESALSQAIRTLRRTLGDDSREPIFILTVTRLGYRFVFEPVIEEDDAEAPPRETSAEAPAAHDVPIDAGIGGSPVDAYEPLLTQVTTTAGGEATREEQRGRAERLRALGTDESLRRLGTRPGHAQARALLRDARWDVPGAGDVPILGSPAPAATAWSLVQLRLAHATRVVRLRWQGAALGGALAGATGGVIGGLLLTLVPGSDAPPAMSAVLGVIGAACGGAGGAGVGAGVSVAEAIARSQRTLAVTVGAAAGGGLAGLAAHLLATWSLAALVGLRVPIGGALEGLVIGAAIGAAYAATTVTAAAGMSGGVAAPRGRRRAWTMAAVTIAAMAACVLLALTNRVLVGGTIHAIAQASTGAQAALTPLARLFGETEFGRLTSALVGGGEGLLFGLGLSLGLMRRPAERD